MDPAEDVGTERGVDRPVPLDPALAGQSVGLDPHPPVALARSVVARMTRVERAFVQDFQGFRSKAPHQAVANLRFKFHYFGPPSSLQRRFH